MINYIFVYGTLKSGGWNNSLLADCEFVGVGWAKSCVIIDMGGCPGMVPGRGRYGDDAMGEVYSVPDEYLPTILHQLDRLENEGQIYLRAKIQIKLNNGPTLECITYLYMPNLNANIVVRGGEWNNQIQRSRSEYFR